MANFMYAWLFYHIPDRVLLVFASGKYEEQPPSSSGFLWAAALGRMACLYSEGQHIPTGQEARWLFQIKAFAKHHHPVVDHLQQGAKKGPTSPGCVGALELMLCSRTRVLSIIIVIGRELPLAFSSLRILENQKFIEVLIMAAWEQGNLLMHSHQVACI